MLRPVCIGLSLLVLAQALTVTAQEAEPVLSVAGYNDPRVCDPTALELLCFRTTDGDPATAFVAGETARVALTAMPLPEAGDGAPHNLAVIIDGQQGTLSGIDSDSSKAIAISDTAETGDTVFLEFLVPASGTLYFWCDIGDHEFSGMSFTAAIQPAVVIENDTAGNDSAGNGTAGNATDGNATADGDAGSNIEGNETADGDDVMATTQGEHADGHDDHDHDHVEESPAASALGLVIIGLLGVASTRRRHV